MPSRLGMFRRANPWLAVTGVHDNRGANAAAESLGIPRAAYSSMMSPIERQMLWQFGNTDEVHHTSGLAYFMRGVGRMLHFDINGMEADTEALPDPEDWAGITVWDLRTLEDLHEHGSSAAMNQVAAGKGVDLIIGRSRQNDATSLYRTGTTDKDIDLSIIAGMEDVRFAHKGGFFAIVDREINPVRLRQLVAFSHRDGQ